ncbi:HDOD domain-containing protein [Teredinibacter waterburyi]|uniref:HDOD domain-containing protein n=1 Tax=Teredinibacter waterburyi TaxID=1500538 RepID=UPI00165F438E|nr:HDOD domain-containing protein [Teredinibacter waterburyi]
MHEDLTTNQIQKILQGVSIPPQPQIMVDLQMEQLSPTCSINEIARLISQDVGLSGSILKTVNSPYYKHSNTITSITQAVSLMGVNSVVNMVNALSIRGALSDDDIIALGSFWDTAMDIATAAAIIAKRLGIPNPEEAYTLGLFHNCGIPLMMQRFPNYWEIMRESYAQQSKAITEVENIHLHTNHAVVGYYVSKSWNLPSYLCQAIHDHHRVDAAFADDRSDTRKKTLLAVLKIAEHIGGIYRSLGKEDVDYEWERISETVLIYTGLSRYEFANLNDEITEMGLGVNN